MKCNGCPNSLELFVDIGWPTRPVEHRNLVATCTCLNVDALRSENGRYTKGYHFPLPSTKLRRMDSKDQRAAQEWVWLTT